MALDHVRYFVHKSHPSEYWGIGLPVFEGDAIAFLTRLVTHICAPGFFMLMGVSMVLFASRSQQTKNDLLKHFLIRGGILFILQHLVVNVAWFISSLSFDIPKESYGVAAPPGGRGMAFTYFGVLSSLGISMMLSAFLIHLRAIWLILLILLMQGLSYALVINRSPDEEISLLLRLLGIPGYSFGGIVNYPLLPWLSLVLLGLLIGRLIINGKLSSRTLGLVSVACLAGFFALRLMGLGDYNAIAEPDWIGFLNVTKYPASPVFQLLTLGGIFALLLVFKQMESNSSSPFNSFGKSTLFFYVVHLYLYAMIGFIFPSGGAWVFVYISWIAGLIIMLLACQRWLRLKQKYPANHFIHYF